MSVHGACNCPISFKYHAGNCPISPGAINPLWREKPPTVKPRTVRVRIAVTVDADGWWNSEGWEKATDEAMLERLGARSAIFIEADVPLPDAGPLTVQGEVV